MIDINNITKGDMVQALYKRPHYHEEHSGIETPLCAIVADTVGKTVILYNENVGLPPHLTVEISKVIKHWKLVSTRGLNE
jgi:hypothetical protein